MNLYRIFYQGVRLRQLAYIVCLKVHKHYREHTLYANLAYMLCANLNMLAHARAAGYFYLINTSWWNYTYRSGFVHRKGLARSLSFDPTPEVRRQGSRTPWNLCNLSLEYKIDEDCMGLTNFVKII